MPSDTTAATKGDRPSGRLGVYAVVILCWIAYLTLTFTQPTRTDSNAYGLSTWQLNALRLTIAIPYLLIWLAAVRGALEIKAYQESLADGEHRKAFRRIYQGLTWLAVGLIVTTSVSSLRNLEWLESLYPTLTVLLNHLYVLFPLVGFSLIFVGARGLAKEADAHLSPIEAAGAILVAVVATSIQLYLIFTDATRGMPATEGGRATFYLPDLLLVTNYVIPTAASLVLGGLTAAYLRSFSRKSTAVIYEKSLPPLTIGLMLVMSSAIILQLLLSLGQGRLLALGLGAILALVYVFLALQGVGYVLVAKGTGRLAKLQRTLAKYQADAP